ncbi:uncharacterized protein LOC135124766 [Zophobas morio]|uniref:uncharacterized protein LOC135124766 n=1 Tax=Zophobas morio TaxID=2755281 RepID=UPI0030838CBE
MGNSIWSRDEITLYSEAHKLQITIRFLCIEISYEIRRFSFLDDACKRADVEHICKLLIAKPDPHAHRYAGFLSGFSLEELQKHENCELLLDIVFPYAFEDDCAVTFKTMILAMCWNSSFFSRLMAVVKKVTYNNAALNCFCRHFDLLIKKHLIIFLDKFEHVVKAAIDKNFFYRIKLPSRVSDTNMDQYLEIIDMVLSRECLCRELIHAKREVVRVPSYITDPEFTNNTITQFIASFSSVFDEDEITKRVLLMVSYDLRVTLHDLNFVYYKYGYNDLFRILLHMDVYDNVSSKELLSVMVYLHYKPGVDFHDPKFIQCLKHHAGVAPVVVHDSDVHFENDSKVYEKFKLRELETVLCNKTNSLDTLFDYFNQEELKELCLGLCERKNFVEKVMRLPRVCSLVELSRNVETRLIVEGLGVSTAKEFLTVLNGLRVDKTAKSVLALERKIYQRE